MNNKNFNLHENINIDELAQLSGISLSEDEKQRIEADICEFVEFAACLEGYSKPQACRDGISLESLRDDVAVPSEYAQAITNSCQDFEGGLFCVPRTVREEDK